MCVFKWPSTEVESFVGTTIAAMDEIEYYKYKEVFTMNYRSKYIASAVWEYMCILSFLPVLGEIGTQNKGSFWGRV